VDEEAERGDVIRAKFKAHLQEARNG